MVNYSKLDVILIRYPYSEQVAYKVRPAVIVSSPTGPHETFFVVPLTSKTSDIEVDEFLIDWEYSGLNVPSAIKRGIVMIQSELVLKRIGRISANDYQILKKCMLHWLEL